MALDAKSREILDQLRQALQNRFAQSVESMAGTPYPITLGESDDALSEDKLKNPVVWAANYITGGVGKLLMAADEDSWRAVGTLVLEAAGLEDQDDATVRSTYLEILTQAGSSLAPDLTNFHGRKWELGETGVANLTGEHHPGWTMLMDAGGKPVTIHVRVSPGLVESVAAPAAPAERPAKHEPEMNPTDTGRHYDLLLDVELPVSISFGRALVPLKEILKLNSGSIVELNRAVTEPVEVIVNNCVIARGEVVVVEGNYGVRIEQIVSRQDRLRSMN